MEILKEIDEKFIDIDIDKNLEKFSKTDTIKYLVGKLTAAYNLQDKSQKITDEILSREKLMSTGMQHEIAIPHCTLSGIDDVKIYIAISKKGINFEASDSSLSKIIVMLIIPKKNMDDRVKTMASIARFLDNEKVRKNLISADKPSKIIDIFKSIK